MSSYDPTRLRDRNLLYVWNEFQERYEIASPIDVIMFSSYALVSGRGDNETARELGRLHRCKQDAEPPICEHDGHAWPCPSIEVLESQYPVAESP